MHAREGKFLQGRAWMGLTRGRWGFYGRTISAIEQLNCKAGVGTPQPVCQFCIVHKLGTVSVI